MLLFPVSAPAAVDSVWDHTNLTYGFVNGTADIAGDGEQEAVREALQLWSEITPLTFSEVPHEAAEIKISWVTGNHGDGQTFASKPYGDYAHAHFPAWALDGDVHFNDSWTWTASTRSEASEPIDLVTIAGHELGHAIGVMHSNSPFDLVRTPAAAPYSGSHRWLWVNDIDSATDEAYGDNPGYRFLLRNSSTAGAPELTPQYGGDNLLGPTDRPVAGDWNGDGVDTIGIYRPYQGRFYLRNSNTTGVADIEFDFATSEDLPVVGDWNGDGTDTIGIYRPSTGAFHLKDKNSESGGLDYAFGFGNTGDLPVAGDWNKDGKDTVGVYRPSTGAFYLTNSNSVNPPLDYSFGYGNTGDLPVAGDWDENGYDSVGVFRPSNGMWYLDNEVPVNNPLSHVFTYGSVGPRVPVVGDWNKSGTDTPGTYQE